jgi:hypothetical protein
VEVPAAEAVCLVAGGLHLCGVCGECGEEVASVARREVLCSGEDGQQWRRGSFL